MTPPDNDSTFSNIHIDAARNSTDDFNLFHDKNKWDRIRQNPFGGPIVLGFQLQCLIEAHVRQHRSLHNEDALIKREDLAYSNYQIAFISAVKPGDPVSVAIKKSQLRVTDENSTLSNRVVVKSGQTTSLMGYKKESKKPLFLPGYDFGKIPNLDDYPDRSYLPGEDYFLKRKYMTTSNAKNFLAGSLVEQSDYFDEIQDKVNFPELFPASLISCALLERAQIENHDFEVDPMVYTAHEITINRNYLAALKSNDVLNILVKHPQTLSNEKGLGKNGVIQQLYSCFGILKDHNILFRANIYLAPLCELLKSFSGRNAK